MAARLFVGNLSYSTTEDQLREFIETKGVKITGVRIINDRMTGRSRGFGFVQLDSGQDLQEAIGQFDGQELDGRRLSAREAFDAPQRPQGGFDSSRRPHGGGGYDRGPGRAGPPMGGGPPMGDFGDKPDAGRNGRKQRGKRREARRDRFSDREDW